MGAIQILAYAAAAFSVVLTALRLLRIARMPVHLRWDLYPIPHEKGRGAYGGSYYEEIDWWTKPRRFSLAAELRAMAVEIFFVHSLYRHNRPLWLVSYPFHVGLYSLVAFTLLLVVGGAAGVAGMTVAADAVSWSGRLVYYLTLALGTAGWILALAGAVGLGLSRWLRAELRSASLRGDYLNLALIGALAMAGLVAGLTADPGYALQRQFVGNMLTFRSAGDLPTVVDVQVCLTSALLVYFPFTHMTHMFSKFFTYHSVRWEDHPNIKGSKIEQAVTEALGYRLNWAAPHITKGTWAGAADDRKKPGDA